MKKMISFLNKIVELNEGEMQFLEEQIPTKSFKKSEYLLKQGHVSKEFFFIEAGCVRMFYDVDGEEKTAFFYEENSFVSSYQSFTKKTPAAHSFQALEETTVSVISADLAGELLRKFPKMMYLAQVMMEEELGILQDVVSNFITLNAEQRYRKLQDEKPLLLQRIPQYHLATYLGVRPETISRIRSKNR